MICEKEIVWYYEYTIENWGEGERKHPPKYRLVVWDGRPADLIYTQPQSERRKWKQETQSKRWRRKDERWRSNSVIIIGHAINTVTVNTRVKSSSPLIWLLSLSLVWWITFSSLEAPSFAHYALCQISLSREAIPSIDHFRLLFCPVEDSSTLAYGCKRLLQSTGIVFFCH
jgi:hypothetical protein